MSLPNPIDIEIMKVFSDWMTNEWDIPITFNDDDKQLLWRELANW